MYDATLTQSYFPAQGGPEPEPITIGEMLRRSVDVRARSSGPEGTWL